MGGGVEEGAPELDELGRTATQVAEKTILGLENPMGTDGFEFVEYTAPDTELLRSRSSSRAVASAAYVRERSASGGLGHLTSFWPSPGAPYAPSAPVARQA